MKLSFVKKYLILSCYLSFVIPAFSQVLIVEDEFFRLDNKRFDMWGVRVASASQNERYTNSLISNLDDYKANGINSISVFLQGSSGGYSDPFLENGKDIEDGHLDRLIRIINECASREMVVIVGVFYQRTLANPEIRNIENKKDVRNAIKTVTSELKSFRNVIINIANEQNSKLYQSFTGYNFNDAGNIISLCKEVKKVDPQRIVGAGGYHDSLNVVIGKSQYVDVLLFDTFSEDVKNGHDSGWHYTYFKKKGVPDKPIVNVEIFGAWTGKFLPQGVYTPEGKEIHFVEIKAAKKQPGLYVHLHSNHWFQGLAQEFENRFDLGGDGTQESPGVKWFFYEIIKQ